MTNISSVEPTNDKQFVIGSLDAFVFDIDGTYNGTGVALNLPKGYISVNGSGVSQIDMKCVSEIYMERATAGPKLHFIEKTVTYTTGTEVKAGSPLKATVYVLAKKG